MASALPASRVQTDTAIEHYPSRHVLRYTVCPMAEKAGPKRMDGYVRVSRRMGREGPGYISPKIQREAVERWAKYRGVEIVAWHEDEDHSGGTQKRPGLREAIRRIEAGDTEGLACWRLNRFARNVGEATQDVKRIKAADGYVAFVEEDIDPTGPFGEFLLTVLLAVATLERENISTGWRVAKGKAIDRGVKIGKPPIGYERDEDGVLRPSSEADTVKAAFGLAGKEGLSVAMKYLKEQRPDRVWTLSTTRRLLGSRTYLGEISYGDLVNINAHEPLVTRSEWEAAQRPSNQRREANSDYPLSGIAVCAGCGQPLVGSRSNKVRVYRCKYQYSRPYGTKVDCPAPTVISAERLEKYVTHELRRAWLESGESYRQSKDDSGAAQSAQEALEEAEAELYAFASDTTLRKSLGARYHELLEKRVEAVDEAQRDFREKAQNTAQRLHVFPPGILDTASPEELRTLLNAAFSKIEVSRGRGAVERRVRLVLHGAPDPPMPPSKDI